MSFDYNDYFNKLYEMPIFTMTFSAILLILCIIQVFRTLNQKKKKRRLIELIIGCVALLLLFISGLYQFNPAIRNDNPTNTILIQGKITNIKDVFNPPRFYYEGDIVNPKIITINDQEFYIITIGSIDIGDNVEVHYLEKSKVVMEIQNAE